MSAGHTSLSGESLIMLPSVQESASSPRTLSIFFPSSYDQTSPATLPALFTIHGGGFCLGHQRDDDEWNRTFADTHSVLVISLNYSKAPTYPFPTAPHDIEALVLAALEDASLPIDRSAHAPASRTAILGFSAGGNLALSVSRMSDPPPRPPTAFPKLKPS